jgi:hypothetical protein
MCRCFARPSVSCLVHLASPRPLRTADPSRARCAEMQPRCYTSHSVQRRLIVAIVGVDEIGRCGQPPAWATLTVRNSVVANDPVDVHAHIRMCESIKPRPERIAVTRAGPTEASLSRARKSNASSRMRMLSRRSWSLVGIDRCSSSPINLAVGLQETAQLA